MMQVRFLTMFVLLFLQNYLFAQQYESVPEKKRMILIGAGGKKAQEYFGLLKNDVNFVGFVQPNPKEQIKLLAESAGIPIFSDLDAAVQAIDFEGALVVVPHHLHFPYTEALLKQGKFVIKDKPVALTQHEITQYRQLSISNIPDLFIIVQRQFQESFLNAQEELRNIGKIYSFKYEYNLNLKSETQGWRANKDLSGGGALIDMGYHTIDMINTFFGMPTSTQAQCAYKTEAMRQNQLEDEVFILFSYPDDMKGIAMISRYGSEKKETLEIAGQNGMIIVTPRNCAVYDGQGQLVKKHESTASKEEETEAMFADYLNHSKDLSYIEQELQRHENNIALISRILGKQ